MPVVLLTMRRSMAAGSTPSRLPLDSLSTPSQLPLDSLSTPSLLPPSLSSWSWHLRHLRGSWGVLSCFVCRVHCTGSRWTAGTLLVTHTCVTIEDERRLHRPMPVWVRSILVNEFDNAQLSVSAVSLSFLLFRSSPPVIEFIVQEECDGGHPPPHAYVRDERR